MEAEDDNVYIENDKRCVGGLRARASIKGGIIRSRLDGRVT